MDQKQFKTVIVSEHKIFDLHLRETLQYKDLIFLFVKRDFVSKYKQTILGPLWAIIQPLFTTVVFTIVFGSLAGLTTSDINGQYILPGFLFYMAGNICWNYFSGTLSATSNTFIANAATMGKVYYPRLVAPIATAFSNLISFGIQLGMFFIFLGYVIIFQNTSIKITPMLFMMPLCIIQMILLSVGLGIIVSSVTTKYRDLQMLVGFGLSLWQYGSPIAYGLALIPEKYMWIYLLNPITPIITLFRYSVFGFGYFNFTYFMYSWGCCIIILFIGLVLFSRIERTFMDTV